MAWAREGEVGTGQAPEGAIVITNEQRKAAIEGMMSGKGVTIIGGFAVVNQPESPDQSEPEQQPLTEQDYADAIQAHVDAKAASRGYRDGSSLACYVSSTVPYWADEARTFIAWRDAVWVHAYAELANVQGGARPQPEIADLVAELPTIAWPDR